MQILLTGFRISLCTGDDKALMDDRCKGSKNTGAMLNLLSIQWIQSSVITIAWQKYWEVFPTGYTTSESTVPDIIKDRIQLRVNTDWHLKVITVWTELYKQLRQWFWTVFNASITMTKAVIYNYATP